jgi:Sigma-70 region 2
MNINAELGNRVEGPEGPREWEYWQQLVFPLTFAHAARIRSLRAMLPTGIGSIQHHNSQGRIGALDLLLSQYRSTLSLVAYRVLGDQHLVEDAVQRCLLSASRDVPQFENEGAFRSWLVRVLIDEALLILHEREWATHIL